MGRNRVPCRGPSLRNFLIGVGRPFGVASPNWGDSHFFLLRFLVGLEGRNRGGSRDGDSLCRRSGRFSVLPCLSFFHDVKGSEVCW